MSKGHGVRVFVMRCGETEWDQAGRLQGATDLPMCDASEQRVRTTCADCGSISLVLCGDDEASKRTAEIVAERCHAKRRVVSGLSEMNLGLWEGLLESDLEDRYPRVARQWLDDPAGVQLPEGQVFGEAQERICGAIARQCEKLKDNDAVGVVLRPLALGIVRCWLNDLPTSDLWTQVKDRAVGDWYELTDNALKRLPVATPAR